MHVFKPGFGFGGADFKCDLYSLCFPVETRYFPLSCCILKRTENSFNQLEYGLVFYCFS